MIVSPQPQLRTWRDDDLAPLQAMHADPDIAFWLGGPLRADQTEIMFHRLRSQLDAQRWGVWAVQNPDGTLIGVAGLQTLRAGLPGYPGIEATWRLLPSARGKGIITRVMRAVIDDAFRRGICGEIFTMTADRNLRSQAVMHRLGFIHDPARDFLHPFLAQDHPLRRHVFYVIRPNSELR